MHLPAEILIVEESQLHATQLHTMLEKHDVHSVWITTGDTTHTLERDRERCLRAGMGAYIPKPVKTEHLKAMLEKWVPSHTPQISQNDVSIATPRLPLTPTALEESASATNEQPLRLLLAEDNPANQKLALHILSKMGYGVDVVGTGHKALEALAQRPYQLVLMDCQMPKMDGFEATAQIRANDNRPGAYTPIVALTAHAITGDRERCLAAGMDDYLTKPIDREALRTTLEKWGCKPMSTTTNAASGNVSQEVPLGHQFDTPPHHFPLAHK